MPEFTPGPWQWDVWGYLMTVGTDDEGRNIGIGVKDSGREQGPPWQCKPADARLIAAAPKLYEALVAVRRPHLTVVEDCWYSCPKARNEDGRRASCRDSEDPETCTCGADAANAIIDAALAKAGGE